MAALLAQSKLYTRILIAPFSLTGAGGHMVLSQPI
jgi:hypothetical protein